MNTMQAEYRTYTNAMSTLSDLANELTEERKWLDERLRTLTDSLEQLATAAEILVYVEGGGVKSPNYMNVAAATTATLVESCRTILSFVRNAEHTVGLMVRKMECGPSFVYSLEQLDETFATIDEVMVAVQQFRLLFK